jgi:UDP-glucose 4-epimerase
MAANILNPVTRFVCVRYGNVLASRGSVIPLFHDQIRHGGPVTVTVPEMTRFLLTLNEAVDTVFAAIENAKRGETYIPRAPSATVMNIARALIAGRPIKIDVVGIRPGEKMHEILVSEEEAHHCVARGKYYAIRPMLPELAGDFPGEPNALKGEYSSADAVLDHQGTMELLKRHGLLDVPEGFESAEEMLR